MTEPSKWSLFILRGLWDKMVYQGTVTAEKKAKRRARNKRAKIARRANRT